MLSAALSVALAVCAHGADISANGRNLRPAKTIRLLTMNVAGIPFVHPKLSRRFRKLGDVLERRHYDLIAVQEAWFDKDAAYVAQRARLPHYERFPRDIAIGAGLAWISRWPLEHKEQVVFTVRPSALRVEQGEWPANKGVLYAQVQTPKGPLDVYDTHLISSYPDAPYTTIRMTQLYELAEEIERRSAGRPFVLVGDFNAAPGEDGYALVQDLLALEDPCVVDKKDACGATLDDGRRVDQVLVPRGGARFVKARRALEGHGGLDISDHAALEADVDLSLLSLRPVRDAQARARRVRALKTVEEAIDGMAAQMAARLSRRSWIPIYGILMTVRYEHVQRQLSDIRARVETARLVELGSGRATGR